MKRSSRRRQGKASLELIEEAVHLLRTGPVSALAAYYTGTLPFVLGALWFWADMSRSPFALQRIEAASLGLAVLFIWMKFWQMLFARLLRGSMAGELPELSVAAAGRTLVGQTMLHATGLFLLPLSAIFVLPFGWTFASYQNFSALGAFSSGPKELAKRSFRQASLWPRQNHGLLLVLGSFGLIVFFNWLSFGFVLPHLLKMLFGIDSVFTQSAASLLNSTFLAAIAGLTYLSVDPIIKAVYALRCFYGEALQSGEDLKAELKQYAPERGAFATAALLLVTALLLLMPPQGAAAAAPSAPEASVPATAPGTPTTGVSPEDLERSIQEVTHHPKYTWRMPRKQIEESETEPKGVVARFLQRASDLVERFFKAIGRWLDRFFRRVFNQPRQTAGGGGGYGWMMLLQVLLYSLIALTAVALALLLFRFWRRTPKAPAVASEPLQPQLDLADENLGPEQLPEDGWTRLAAELMGKGEWRLAVRAFYLASLAHLAQRNLISLARFKSNRDYERELRRRAHAFPAAVSVFGENVSVFEGIWYGMHEVNGDLVTRFAAKVEQLKRAE